LSKISAQIVADSLNEFGDRLTTFIVVFPRIVLAEFNTHRMFSRNSASSRAIPFNKMVKSVEEGLFEPIKIQKDHSGMQGTEYFTGWREKVARLAWRAAAKGAVFFAKKLNKLGVTKQLANRMLETFMYHKVIITSNREGLENFINLRAHPAAEIHIAKLAELMLEAYNESIPKRLVAGQWHIPFGDDIDLINLAKAIDNCYPEISDSSDRREERDEISNMIKIAVARCARVSYTVVGEEDKPANYENDIKLHDRLNTMGHYSPFEHVGRAMSDFEYTFKSSFQYDPNHPQEGTWGWSGNFKGFTQYRKMLPNECKKDSRVILK
jgi:thymidylate synthase ThyX